MIDAYLLIRIGHILGAALGVGGATVSDILFFRSIKDRKITKDEINLLSGASAVVWAGLIILIISGLSFLTYSYVTSGDIPILDSSKFQAKMTIVLFILINGIVFHTKVYPFMQKYAGVDMHEKEVTRRLPLLAATGALSITSWYFAFIFGMLSSIPYPYLLIMTVYLLIVSCGILFAYFVLSYEVNHVENARKRIKRVKKKSRKGLKKFVAKAIIFAVIFGVVAYGVVNYVVEDDEKKVCVLGLEPYLDPIILMMDQGETVVWEHCDSNNIGEHAANIILPSVLAHEGEDHLEFIIVATSGPELFTSSNYQPEGEELYKYTFTKEGLYEYTSLTNSEVKGIIVVGDESKNYLDE